MGKSPEKATPETAAAGKIDLLRAAVVIDGLIVAVLALSGLVLIYYTDQHNRPEWGGFVLVGLALLIYMMRGQVITRLSVGKDGVAWETAQAALSKAQEAADAASQNSAIIDQQLTAGGTGRTRAAAPAGEEQLDWSHPALDKVRKSKSIVQEDPQAGRWGGQAERNGRLLTADYSRAERSWVEVTLKVTSTDAKRPLTRPVRFHLHDTFTPQTETVKPKDGVAMIRKYAWGAFTVGAEVANEPDSYLELNLATDSDAPEGWRDR